MGRTPLDTIFSAVPFSGDRNRFDYFLCMFVISIMSNTHKHMLVGYNKYARVYLGHILYRRVFHSCRLNIVRVYLCLVCFACV